MTVPTTQPITKWHLTILVSLLTMIGPFTIDAYLPAFESIEKNFSISRALMTQTLGSYIVAFGASTLVWGALTDSIGRKPVILFSVGAYVIASIACAMAQNYEQFLSFRIFQGLAAGGALIAGRAMVRDVLDTKDAQQVMAQAMMLFSASPVIAPLFGAFLHDLFGWRSIFWFLVIYGCSVIVYALIVIQETLQTEDKKSIHIKQVSSVYFRTLKNPHYVRLVLIFTAVFSSFFVFIAGAPTVIFDMLGLGTDSFYILFLPVVIGITSGSAVTNHLLNHYSATQILNLAIYAMFFIASINLGLNAFMEESIARIIIPIALSAFFMSMIMPVISVEILNCFPNNRGSASAMQSFIQMGFNGLAINLIVASLGVLLFNFTLAQVTLMSIAVLLWLFDMKAVKKT